MSIAEILDAVVDVARSAEPADLAAIRGRLHEADAVAMERQVRAATNQDRMLTMAEVAQRLGITEKSARLKAAAGAIPGAQKIGPRAWRVNAAELEAGLRKGKVG
jgi:predicted DNA-binding transcriptional regulator AlpA